MKRCIFIALIACITFVMPMTVNAAEAYAALSNDNTTLTFYYDNEKSKRGGMSIGPFSARYDDISWYNHREDITTVVFDDSFSDYSELTSTVRWFDGFINLTSIVGMNNLRTDNVTDMYSMFENCSSLTEIDLTHFNTSKVTRMHTMFSGCSSLKTIDLSHFDTKAVVIMTCMFYKCSSLETLDLSNFETINVTAMYEMFYGCSSLTDLKISNFDTSTVNDMRDMFANCSSLSQLDVSHFNTENVTSFHDMFLGCSSLTSLDLSHFNTEKIREMTYMFANCSSLKTLDLSSFNTYNLRQSSSMFMNCTSLQTIFVSEAWTLPSIQEGKQMFKGCSNLVGGNGTTYDPSHDNYQYARIDGTNQLPGYFTYKAAPVTDEKAKDGDTFTSNTIDGVEMTFCIISELEKTCEVYGKYDSNGFLKPAFPDLEGGKITIPSEANGYKVIGVGHGAFNNCEILDSVFIPNTVTYIGNEAFIGCKNLVSADLPERLSSIGDGAFSNCTGLPAIIIPEGVITIGKSAFDDCYPVFAILPKTITSIGSQALAFRPAYLVSYMDNPVDVDQFMFERLTSSTTILYIPKGTSAKYEAAGWTQFLKIKEIDEKLPESRGDQFYEITQEKIWINLVVTDTDLKTCELESVANGTRGKVIIPEIAKGFHITSMKKSIFKNTPTYQYNLTSVILPEGLKEIPDSAFYGCRNLYSVTIPESVKGIGHFAFTDCRSLEFVKIPESINSIGKNAFSDCLALSSVIIPKSITEISISTFQNCINLISVDLPESITEIGAGAFSQCTSLTDIKLPVNLTNIGSRGFINCSALKTILIPEGIKTLEQSVFQGCAIETIVIPEGVSRINKWAFSNCQKLDSIDISSTVTTIGNEVFYGSTPSVVTSRIQKPFTINANVFSNYSGKLRVPIGAKELYNKTTAWKNFSVIEEMFGDTIHATTIEGISMTFIITSEEEHTCMVCRRPSAPCIDANTEGQVTIPEEVNGYKVAIIGTESFIGCTKLTSVVIPSTVTNINDKAFTECANLTIVKSYVTDVFEISENVFQYTDENNNLVFSKATLFVPFGKVVDYLNKSAWNKFEIIEELDTEQVGDVFMVPESKLKFRVTSVSERTCEVAGTSETKQIVHSVNIPTTASRYAVTGIGRNAFYQFFYLKSIKIPSTVKYIGSGAFSITALTSVSIPESVESIGSGAFAGDSNLETVTLPRGLKTIASSTFTECGFTEITLPESLEVIEQEAFFKCKQLSRISIPSGVTEIQELAFAKCPSLKCVISHIPEPFAIAKDVFVESEEDYLNPELTYNATLYVPEGTKEKYENQTAWNLFSKIIELGNSSPGDVNGDGTLSAVDILEVVNYILGNASDILNMDAADVNGDGVVNIADIVQIIYIILRTK